MCMDYSKIGLKAGLEIHQQLDTNKLFCCCPSLLRSDNPDFEISRKLHAIAGETGEVDVAVAHEAMLDREFIYQGYNDTTCLIELDEEPPHEINCEALKIVLQIAMLLNCEIYPITQVMRKTVIDGSNTGGFQRTLMIARNGFVEINGKRFGIESVALEEDAARIIERNNKKVIYRLDRLGIPLVEITTKPDMTTPEEVKEVALHIGDILRACNVKRGIGTIRQDVNISIKGHPRVEIKGFQEPRIMIDVVNKEIERQQKEKKGISHVRKTNPDATTEFMRPMPGSARMYPETDLELLKISREIINEVKANLPKLRSEIKGELKKKGLSDELIGLVVKSGMLEELKELLNVYDDVNLIAKMLVLWPKDISAKIGKNIEKVREILNLDVLSDVLEVMKKQGLSSGEIQEVLLNIANGKNIKEALNIEKIETNEIEQFVIKLIKENPGLRANAYMGLVMKEFRGKVSGGEVMKIIGKYVKG